MSICQTNISCKNGYEVKILAGYDSDSYGWNIAKVFLPLWNLYDWVFNPGFHNEK